MTKYASDALHVATHLSCSIQPTYAYDLIGSERSAKALGKSKPRACLQNKSLKIVMERCLSVNLLN